MKKIPVIVGIGGMNSAGRSSGFHGYKRLVCDALSAKEMENTWKDLAHRMKISDIEKIKQGTLVRKISSFDPENVICHHKARMGGNDETCSFIIKKAKLPKSQPENWTLQELENNEVRVTVRGAMDILIPGKTAIPVMVAGNIPTGFDPGILYNSHHHPRGLKLAIYGASDVINSLGMEWDEILKHIRPDEVSVYAGSALSQIDENSMAGLISQPLTGNRINSKMLALSLAEMSADFINSYVINSVGASGTNMGACATFLYNLRQGIQDIKTGQARVVIVGNAEAPITPEIIEGFCTMGALATDDDLCALDRTTTPDYRRACRPFSTNAGFVIAESAQFFVLMEDELALKLGANIYGSVADVFINADGNKKSITGPGVGNYVTVAKAAALAKAILGKEGLKKTYVQAHGTGTPQNRTTESHILNEVAKTFELTAWPVAAIKSYVGHAMSASAGDQLMAALGVWRYGYIPGIKTIDHIAEDVNHSNLNILRDHYYVGEKGCEIEAAIINAKGFGGNNATALVLSEDKTLQIMQGKYGVSAINQYKKANVKVKETAEARDLEACLGKERIIYKFGECVMDHSSVSITQKEVRLSRFTQEIRLPSKNPFEGDSYGARCKAGIDQ